MNESRETFLRMFIRKDVAERKRLLIEINRNKKELKELKEAEKKNGRM